MNFPRPLGLIDRDPPSDKDLLLSARAPVPADYKPLTEQLANLAYIRSWRFQKKNSCVGHGVSKAYRTNSLRAGLPDVDPSAEDIYVRSVATHTPKGQPLADDGTYIRSAFDVVKYVGCALQEDWPEVDGRMEPSPLGLKLNGLTNARGKYWRLTGTGDQLLREVCFTLDNFGEIVSGKQVGYAYSAHRGDGVLAAPSAREVSIGGHCTTYCGYLDGGRELLEHNHWRDFGYAHTALGSDGVERHVQSMARVSSEWLVHPWMQDLWAWIPDIVLPREVAA